MPSRTSDHVPPFPPNLPLAPVQKISLSSLLSKDPAAITDLNTACRTHGFFYLNLSSSPDGLRLVDLSQTLHALAHDAFALPLEQKQPLRIGKHRSIFGWKAAGIVSATDEHQRKDRGEMWNISKDDMLGQSEKPVPYPSVIAEAKATLAEFDKAAHQVCMRVLELLAEGLDIAPEEMRRRHRIEKASGDHSRFTWGPGDHPDEEVSASGAAASSSSLELGTAGQNASGTARGVKDSASTKITTYAHTDFGTITLLFNWLGGLQIESHEADPATGDKEWQWVMPLADHAIVNLGDSMVHFTAGKLKSGKHRVVAAPGEQARLERYSLVYFVRPEDDVILEDLTGTVSSDDKKRWKAKEWIEQQARSLGNTVKKD